MALERISSRENPRIKRLVRLMGRRREREESGLFACEGARLCADADASGLRAAELFVTEAALRRYPQLQGAVARAQTVCEITDALAAQVCDTKTPQGVVAVYPKLDIEQTAVTIKDGGKYLVLSSLQDPGNLGTILRSADAFGADGLFLSADCPDLYSPKVLRSSMGGVFRLRHMLYGNIEDCIRSLKGQGVAVYAAALEGDPGLIDEMGGAAASAALIGNEGNGLPPNLIELCTASVAIPMAEGAESLNAAVAASILIWEMNRRKLEVRSQR